jgi:hypothetical protein
MPSQTEIVNYSLDMVNQSPINDLDALDAKSQKCKRIYNMALGEVLEEEEWKFNKARVEISADPVAPISEWSYSYQLPPDCGQPKRINDNDAIEWELEGDKILTDTPGPIILEYIKNEQADPNKWLVGFRKAFCTYLSARYAEAFPQDGGLASSKMQEYEHNLQKAMANNGQVGPVLAPPVTHLTTSIRRY